MRGLPYNNSCVAGNTTAMRQKNTGCGSAWLERLGLGPGGRRFESCHPDYMRV